MLFHADRVRTKSHACHLHWSILKLVRGISDKKMVTIADIFGTKHTFFFLS